MPDQSGNSLNKEELIESIEALSDMLGAVEELTKTDTLIDLNWLSDQVGYICENVEILTASGEHPPKIIKAMEDVLNRMDRLGELILIKRDLYSDTVDDLTHHRRAVTAYGRAPASIVHEND